jgi:hypothetical protein
MTACPRERELLRRSTEGTDRAARAEDERAEAERAEDDEDEDDEDERVAGAENVEGVPVPASVWSLSWRTSARPATRKPHPDSRRRTCWRAGRRTLRTWS